VFFFPQHNTGEEHAAKEVNMMSIFDDANVISAYPLNKAIEDGVLVEIFKNSWHELSGGKPIVATAHLHSEILMGALNR
jgi:hypothetical protein